MDFVCLGIRAPRCGSGSLRYALEAAFAGRRSFYLPGTLDLRGAEAGGAMSAAVAAINAEARPGDLVVGGHFDLAFARQAIDRPTRAITILRDPAARCVSEYDSFRQAHQDPAAARRRGADPRVKVAAERSLTGYLDYLVEHGYAYGDVASRCLGWDGTEPLAGYFERNVFHAGVLEKASAFADGLAEKLGRPVAFPWVNSGLGRTADGADPEARRRMERLYARDFELYEHVRAASRADARGLATRRIRAVSPVRAGAEWNAFDV